MIINLIAKSFLFLNKAEFMIPLALLGYIFHDREKWTRTIYIMLLATIVVAYLKSIWQVPLQPWVKSDSWAFPSGHMFVVTSFYLWISKEMNKRWITNLSYIILLGVGLSLIQQKYHITQDVIGAFGFALIFLYLYNIIVSLKPFAKNPDYLVLILLPLSLIIMFCMPIIPPHVFHAVYGIVGFGLFAILHSLICKISKNSKQTITAH